MPRGFSARGGDVSFSVDTRDIAKLARDLKGVEGEVLKELRKRMRNALEPAKAAVKAEASWSSRIPGAVTGRVSYPARGVTARVVVNSAKAPHAKALNNSDKGGTFRHPVWGGDTWVSQQARPFIKQAGNRARPEVIREVAKVFDDIARRTGFTR